MTEHTATPWYAQHRHIYKHDWMPGTDHAIADADKGPTEAEALANAAFIVRACNSHADLLAALEDVMEWIRNWEPDFTDDVEWRETETKARAAIEGAKP